MPGGIGKLLTPEDRGAKSEARKRADRGLASSEVARELAIEGSLLSFALAEPVVCSAGFEG